jgi:peptide/nickel transport system substrate-binding protein
MDFDTHDSVLSNEIEIKPKHTFTDTLIGLGTFERFVVSILFLIVLVSGTQILYTKNQELFIEVPRHGGTHIEGIVGTPRFINPLLAISQADKDLTALVYAGLLTRDKDGVLIPELASSYSISEDGLTYTFTLRDNLTFHDNTPLTADDVLFTIAQAADPAVRSPVFSNWDGVIVEKIDDVTIAFTLPEPYAPFIDNMTLGILPSHIWERLTAEEFPFSQFNITPVGGGPYKIAEGGVVRDNSGIPSGYNLTKFDEYALGTPYINTIKFILYNNAEEAIAGFTAGEVYAINSVSPARLDTLLRSTEANTHTDVYRAPLLRIFGIFFNHNKQPIFLEDEVREALDIATPKKAIVGEILRGFGSVLESPLPEYIIETTSDEEVPQTETLETESDVATSSDASDETEQKTPINRIERAQAVLEDAGWEKGDDGVYMYENDDSVIRLSFTFSTVDNPELVQTAERIAESWREVGVEVELKVFEATDLTQTVIRPRRFDALLFGMVIGHELDLYAFWHSSQRNDPGLNIAQYADIEADALLEAMRTETNPEKRRAMYIEFSDLIRKQTTAIFLYAPDFIYVTDDRLQDVQIHPVKEAYERFDSVHLWHVETDRVWPFVKDLLRG